MALETLKGITEIGGFEVGFPILPANEDDHEGRKNWMESLRKFVIINHNTNTIAFKIQNGPIKEVGSNGAQVDTMIEAAKLIIEGLNKQFPCIENEMSLHHLKDCLYWQDKRKKDRELRNVEGTSND